MNIQNRFIAAAKAFVKDSNGATLSGRGLSRDFLKNGNKDIMNGNWSAIRLADKDMYRGYPYAAITLRAKTVARLATNSDVVTTAYNEKAVDNKSEATHPYLKAFQDSINFDNYLFWYDNSQYIDMRGVRHIAVVRGKVRGTVGDIQEVFALNPYRVLEVVNQADGEIGGYVETQKNTGKQRIWEPHQIIRVVDEHPITEDPHGMIEAAKDAQFTLKQAADFTRSSLNANENAPGIISSKIVLTPEQFANFKAGIKSSPKGQPIITNGGQVDWQAMNIDLDKSALDKINEIQRSELFAVSGQSKTSMGIEESGTTRDTSEVQDDKTTRDQAIPVIQLFASAFNLDYRKHYPNEYKKFGWEIKVVDPTSKNIDADKSATELRDTQFDLADKLVGKGYEAELANKYAQGRITLEELGKPTEEPRTFTPIQPVEDEESQQQSITISPVINIPEVNSVRESLTAEKIAEAIIATQAKIGEKNDIPEDLAYIYNQLEVADVQTIDQQQGALTNGIVNVDSRIVSSVLNKVDKNDFKSQSDIISEEDREEAEQELEFLLIGFYTILAGLYGRNFMQKRAKDIGELAEFRMTAAIASAIKDNANKAAKSHVNTVLDELLRSIQTAYDEATEIAYKALLDSGEQKSKALYEKARRMALEGAGRQQIISAIKATQTDISSKRATNIARNETRKAFTQTQFEADTQFLKQNGWYEVAEKRWRTNSAKPCQLCIEQAARSWIPFKENFVNKGDTLSYDYTKKDGTVSVRTVQMDYENIDAGVLHNNCQCDYELRVRTEEE